MSGTIGAVFQETLMGNKQKKEMTSLVVQFGGI